MKSIMMIGALLIVLGVCGLAFRSIRWTETRNVANIGPLQINSQEDHSVWIPTIAGVAAIVTGLGLVMIGRRSS